MVVERRYSYHETQEVLQMLGENYLGYTNRRSEVTYGGTLLIKVKTYRGDPLNEEADIRAELGRLKEHKETIWNDSTDRTVYQ